MTPRNCMTLQNWLFPSITCEIKHLHAIKSTPCTKLDWTRTNLEPKFTINIRNQTSLRTRCGTVAYESPQMKRWLNTVRHEIFFVMLNKNQKNTNKIQNMRSAAVTPLPDQMRLAAKRRLKLKKCWFGVYIWFLGGGFLRCGLSLTRRIVSLASPSPKYASWYQ